MVRSVCQCRLCRVADFPRFFNSASTCRCRPLPEVGQKLPLRAENGYRTLFPSIDHTLCQTSRYVELAEKDFFRDSIPTGTDLTELCVCCAAAPGTSDRTGCARRTAAGTTRPPATPHRLPSRLGQTLCTLSFYPLNFLLFPSRSGYLAARESYESGIVSLLLPKKCLEIS